MCMVWSWSWRNDKTHAAKSEGHQRAWRESNHRWRTLGGPILMKRVGSRRLDCVPRLSKLGEDFLAATKPPSKIHPNIFGIGRRSGTLGGKPPSEPLDGWSEEPRRKACCWNGCARVRSTCHRASRYGDEHTCYLWKIARQSQSR
jgi:hypothetical protein